MLEAVEGIGPDKTGLLPSLPAGIATLCYSLPAPLSHHPQPRLNHRGTVM